jgi:hypothetical protein
VVVELVGYARERLSKLLTARSSDDDQKTWVLLISGCSTNLCDQFSENLRSVVRSLLDVVCVVEAYRIMGFFEVGKRRMKMDR